MGAARTPRKRSLARRVTAPAVWGWYGVAMMPTPEAQARASGVSSKTALVQRDKIEHAFWAAWWTADPREEPEADPDDYGIVSGPKPFGQAVSEAYDALRRGRGPRVYDMSVGAARALHAYRDGAPRKRSKATDFDSLAEEGYVLFGLAADAKPSAVTKAFMKMHPDHGGDPDTDMAKLTGLYRAVLGEARRREAERQRAKVADGKAPRRRPKKRAELDADHAAPVLPLGPEPPSQHTEVIERIARRVAARVRKKAEQLGVLLGTSPMLEGLCMVASLGLVEALKEAGLPARVAGGTVRGGHYWAEIPLPDPGTGEDPGALWVDVTATQFWPTGPKVSVLMPGAPRRKAYERRADGAFVVDFLLNSAMPQRQLAKTPARWWADDVTIPVPVQKEAE